MDTAGSVTNTWITAGTWICWGHQPERQDHVAVPSSAPSLPLRWVGLGFWALVIGGGGTVGRMSVLGLSQRSLSRNREDTSVHPSVHSSSHWSTHLQICICLLSTSCVPGPAVCQESNFCTQGLTVERGSQVTVMQHRTFCRNLFMWCGAAQQGPQTLLLTQCKSLSRLPWTLVLKNAWVCWAERENSLCESVDLFKDHGQFRH